jgi:hypothetical protein
MNAKYSLFALALAVAACLSPASAQVDVHYSFDNVQYSKNGSVDTFTQFLGINNSNLVAGYHGASVNKGFTYDVATKTFTDENFPNSAQTQVTGINNENKTVGFYMTTGSVSKTIGFQMQNGVYGAVGQPGEPFNQLLGQNDHSQASGYYSTNVSGSNPDHGYIYDESGAVFETFLLPNSQGGVQATGINNSDQVCGFVIDSNNISHGWLEILGDYTVLNYPQSSSTMALGLNNKGQVVGTFNDASGTHGFVYYISSKQWQQIDDPDGFGTTIVNGINDNGALVGFFGTSPINTAFVATPPAE